MLGTIPIPVLASECSMSSGALRSWSSAAYGPHRAPCDPHKIGKHVGRLGCFERAFSGSHLAQVFALFLHGMLPSGFSGLFVSSRTSSSTLVRFLRRIPRNNVACCSPVQSGRNVSRIACRISRPSVCEVRAFLYAFCPRMTLSSKLGSEDAWTETLSRRTCRSMSSCPIIPQHPRRSLYGVYKEKEVQNARK